MGRLAMMDGFMASYISPRYMPLLGVGTHLKCPKPKSPHPHPLCCSYAEAYKNIKENRAARAAEKKARAVCTSIQGRRVAWAVCTFLYRYLLNPKIRFDP